MSTRFLPIAGTGTNFKIGYLRKTWSWGKPAVVTGLKPKQSNPTCKLRPKVLEPQVLVFYRAQFRKEKSVTKETLEVVSTLYWSLNFVKTDLPVRRSP